MTSPLRVKIHVQPGAAQTAIAGMHGDCVKIRLNARPIDGAANEALVIFVAKRLGIAKRRVRIVTGLTSRRKIIEIEGVTAQEIAAALC